MTNTQWAGYAKRIGLYAIRICQYFALVLVPRTRYARSGTTNIAYRVFGNGDIHLIIIPGWISNIEALDTIPPLAAWLRYLATFCKVVVFDKRGTGLSDRVNENELPDLSQRIEDLLSILNAVGIDRATLLGISEGGPMAIRFCTAHPTRVSSLILIGAFAKWVRSRDYPFGMTIDEHQQTIDYMFAHWGEAVGLQLMAPSVCDDPDAQRQWASFLRNSASPATARAFYEMNIAIDVRIDLPKVSVPTLIMHRKDDRLIESGHSKFLHEHIPGARLLLTDGRDHLPWYGASQEEILTLQTFLQNESMASIPANPHGLSADDIFRLYELKSFLENHFDEEITISSLVRQFGLNDFKVKAGFRALFDTSVIKYLTLTRLDNACKLLAEPHRSIDDIANAVGYQHRSNFSTAFKKAFGLTPNAYRRKIGIVLQG